MKKPLSVTSPIHAVALAVYFILGLMGLFYVLGISSSSALAQALNHGMGDVWGTSLMVAGFGAFLSAIAASRASSPEGNLRLEMIFAFAMSISMFLFTYLVSKTFGMVAVTSILQSVALGLGCLLRSVQIFFELRLIKRARAHPSEADPVMGDPRDEPERG